MNIIVKGVCLVLLIASFGNKVFAQDTYSSADSIEYSSSTILQVLRAPDKSGYKITVNESKELEALLQSTWNKNRSGAGIQGWRVRIYRGSAQDARDRAKSVQAAFSATYPGVAWYITYPNPNWYVTVGNFRTKDEAERFRKGLLGQFPGAFLVKETIKFPSL